MVKTTLKLCKKFFFYKTDKKYSEKTRDETFCTFAGMTQRFKRFKTL